MRIDKIQSCCFNFCLTKVFVLMSVVILHFAGNQIFYFELGDRLSLLHSDKSVFQNLIRVGVFVFGENRANF